jgi:hypothetical protein
MLKGRFGDIASNSPAGLPVVGREAAMELKMSMREKLMNCILEDGRFGS